MIITDDNGLQQELTSQFSSQCQQKFVSLCQEMSSRAMRLISQAGKSVSSKL